MFVHCPILYYHYKNSLFSVLVISIITRYVCRMYSSLERYIPLFENYLKSDSPETFIRELNDATDRTILTILTDTTSDIIQFRRKVREVGIPRPLEEALTQFRYRSYLKQVDKLGEDEISRQIRSEFSTNNFDYPKPSHVSDHGPSKQEDKTPTCLTLEQNYQRYLEHKLKSKPSLIRNLSDYAISKLPQATLMNLPHNEKAHLLDNCCILYHFKPQFISHFLVRYEEEVRKTNKNYSLEKKLFSELTRDQINSLGKVKSDLFSNEDYVELWFNLNYSERINKFAVGTQYFTKEKHLNKRDLFIQIVKQLEHHKHAIIKAYIRQLKAEILMLDIQVSDPELNRLVDYLQSDCYSHNIRGIDNNYRNDIYNRRNNQVIYKPRMRYSLEVNQFGFENTIESYIEKLFKMNKDNKDRIKRLGAFFREQYLNKLNIDAMLSRGEVPANVHDYYSATELEAIKNKKQIKLHSSNKRKYKASDAVVLHATLKNVKTIHIKVYELNLVKTSLLGQNRVTDNEVNLNFLKPSQEDFYQHKFINSYAMEDVDIPINIPKRMGVFIVDLQGETVTSRAVIKKGAILCLESFTEAGQTFSFYDEDGRPLTSKEGLKVWNSGTPVNLKDGNSFETDYKEESDEWIKIVASMGSYAQIYEKRIQVEKYTFEVGYLYTPESFVVGKKAKILLHGRLKMNNNPMSLQLLQNIKATINVTNNQDISTFFEFDIKKWFDTQDQVIEFPIQSYTQNISINVTAKIMKQSNKETTLSSQKHININLGEDRQNFSDFYLERDQKGLYSLNLKGLNGESIPNVQVLITYAVRGVQEQEKTTLKTNDEGVINLGVLSNVKLISARTDSDRGRIDRTWVLSSDSTFHYPKEFHVKMGHQFTLPVDKTWTKNDITLLRTFDKYHSDDYSSVVEVKDGLLTLPAFTEEGYYIMKLLPIEKDIDIYTLKDIKWAGDTEHKQTVFDHSEGNIYTITNNPTRNLAIGQINLFHEPESNKVQISLANVSKEELKNVRVHAFATNYIPPNTQDLFSTANFNQQPGFTHQNAGVRTSSYYSNKYLSDEGAYVWNRQQKKETQVGNNLEKPGVFLKRALVRETNQQEEDLYEGDLYQDECAMVDVDPNMKAALKKKKDKADSKGISLERNCLAISSHNNFLLASGHLETNLRGEKIEIEVPLNYNQLELVVLTPTSAIKKQFSLKSSNRQFKDLRHVGIAETQENKAWTMSREVYALKAGEERLVSRTSQWRTVGLKDIFEYANAKRMALYEWSKHLLVWHNYDQAKKRAIYDKECCHELNTFIKFKDPQFFNSVVSNYLANKIVKTFVDYCLLEDIPQVKEYVNLSRFNLLNAFERALLVHTLVKAKTLEGQAKRIVEIMEMEQNSIKRNYQDFKHNFDTIINAKATEEESRRQGARTKQTARMSSASKGSMRFTDTRMDVEEEEDMMQIQCVKYQGVERRRDRMAEKKPFMPVESTKQYTERTYYTVKNYKEQAPNLVWSSQFWSSLARSFLQGNTQDFLSKDFMTIPNSIGFILAACFISSESSANFQIQPAGQNYKLTAQAPLLLFVKEVKEQEYASKFGVQMNQRFLDPQNRYIYEDGIQIDRQVEEFVINRPYISQTVVTNTSGTALQLQILLDIPKGTIPLLSHEYTQIVNITLAAFTSKQFTRMFYCPSEGEYPIYPSNACRGSTIISRCARKPNIVVKRYLTTNKLESFNDILSSADNAKIIEYIKAKNLMDRNVFSPEAILWLLKDKAVYEKVLGCLRERKYYNFNIWNFAFYHNDIKTIRQIVDSNNNCELLEVEMFEYFPYYSTRTHQFANQAKSTIRNVQFKQTYIRFLTTHIVNINSTSAFLVSFAYYLILQDRLKEAANILKKMTEKYPNEHQIQVDYMRCFLDMSLNTHNFSQAREIVNKYKEYPIESWRKLFDEVRRTLEVQDEEFPDSTDSKKPEEFHTQVVQESDQFKIIQPAETNIRVQIFEIDLETYFSEYPFIDDEAWYCFVQPSISLDYAGKKETTEIVIKRADYPQVRNATVAITDNKPGLPPKKVATFTWSNPQVKVKVSENTGTIQVFVGRKKRPGAYVKIFSQRGNHINKFYRDGYTDMTGTFRYAMSDLQQIKEFSILVVTDKGSLIVKAKPPSKLASY